MFEADIRRRGHSGKPSFLCLPAAPYELLDALDRIGAKRLEEVEAEITGTVWEIPDLEPSPDFACLNALAEKLSTLEDGQRIAFLGLAAMESQGKPLPVLRALDLAYSTDCCHVVEALNDEQLGRFYAEEGFVSDLEDLPDSLFDLLDFEQIGREIRVAETGVFVEPSNDSSGGYVLRHSELKQAPPVPDQIPKPGYIFRFALWNQNTGDAVLLDLPAPGARLDEALKGLHAETWDDVIFADYDGAIPNLPGICEWFDGIEQPNELAEVLKPVVEGGQLAKFNAVLEASQCADLDRMAQIAEHLDEYVFSPNLRTGRDFALSELQCMLDGETRELLLPHLDVEGFGRAIAEYQNAAITVYGAIERRDGGPIQDVGEPDQGMEATMQ